MYEVDKEEKLQKNITSEPLGGQKPCINAVIQSQHLEGKSWKQLIDEDKTKDERGN